MFNKLLLAILTMTLILFSCTLKKSGLDSPQEPSGPLSPVEQSQEIESTQVEETEEPFPFPQPAISNTQCRVRECTTGETKDIRHSTPMTILRHVEDFYEVRLVDQEGTWKIDETQVVIGQEAMTEHITSRLLSTFQESPQDEDSWHQRQENFIHNNRLTKETLLSTVWKPNSNSWTLLVFFSDNIYKFGGYRSGVLCQGTYEIIGNNVILHDFFMETNVSVNPENEAINLEMTYSDLNHFDATQGLVNQELDLEFKAMGAPPKAGAKVYIEGFQAFYMDQPGYILNDCSGVREFYATAGVELEPGLNVQVLANATVTEEKFYYIYFERVQENFMTPYHLWVYNEDVELVD